MVSLKGSGSGNKLSRFCITGRGETGIRKRGKASLHPFPIRQQRQDTYVPSRSTLYPRAIHSQFLLSLLHAADTSLLVRTQSSVSRSNSTKHLYSMIKSLNQASNLRRADIIGL